jgi:hypothetical protein
MKKWIKDLDTKEFGPGAYSQSYQDQVLDHIFAHVPAQNPTPFCVEFGFNSTSLTQGTGANVASLILKNKWDSLLLDGENENPEINLYKHFLLPSTIHEVFKHYLVPSEPEYISIDVDSTDLWLFEALLKSHRAMVFSVEYNSHFPLDAVITFPNDPNETWQGDRAYGASLKALTLVAQKHGYSLLWVVPHYDAFFIRNDLIEDGSGQICFPFSKWKPCTEIKFHPPVKDRKRLHLFIDYEVYTRTNGDMAKSRASAYPVCKRHLQENWVVKASRMARTIWKGSS